MGNESTTIAKPSTLIEAWMDRGRRSPAGKVATVSLALLVLLFLASYLDGVLLGPINITYWRYTLMAPAMVAYVLLTQPTSARLRAGAIRAFRPLVPMDDERFRRALSKAPMFDRRREWIALCIGAAAGVLVTRSAWPNYEYWTTLYIVLAAMVMFGLLGWLVYSFWSGTRLLPASLVPSPDLNVFDMAALEPIGRWSLAVASLFIGGTALSLLFLPQPARLAGTAVMYGVLTLTPVIFFFLNMVNVRRVMASAKKQELQMVHKNLAAASRALRESGDSADAEEMSTLLSTFSAWVAVEQRVKAVPEWPYSSGIRRRLAVALLLPITVGVGQGLLTQILLTLLN